MITGGVSGTTSEFVGGFLDDELKIIPGPELPMDFSGHCSVKINQTHVLLTGTADYFNGDQTLIVDVSSADNYTSMIFGSKMNQKRHYHACGTFIHEGKIQVVVAGNHPDSSDLRSTEIWDITFDNGWIQGKNSYIFFCIIQGFFIQRGFW